MQTIQLFSKNNTYVFQSGRYKEVAEQSIEYDLAFKMASKFPKATSRVWKAAKLVCRNRITPVPDELRRPKEIWDRQTVPIFKVASLTSESTYTIFKIIWKVPELGAPLPEKQVMSCNCYDYTKKNAPIIAGQRLCKHILAVRMRRFMQNMTQNEPEHPLEQLHTIQTFCEPEKEHPETIRIMREAKQAAQGYNRWLLRQRAEQRTLVNGQQMANALQDN